MPKDARETGAGEMKSAARMDKAFLAICIVFGIYAALFIYRTSFVIEGRRYFSLFDDAMISMTYARNLAQGHGLVWNAGGERVEGITNLGWTLYMALLHLLPVAQSKISALVQASAAALLVAGLAFTRRIAIAISGGSAFVWIGSVVAAAFYLPIVNWSLQGMEVALLILLVNAALYKSVRSISAHAFSPWPYALLAVAMLVRLDMAMPFAVVLAFFWATDRGNRSRHLAWGLGLFAAAVVSQTVFRLAYYGDFLPNTYYLKIAGYPFLLRLTRGLYVTFVFIWRLNWVLFAVPIVLLVTRRERREVLLGVVLAGQLAYSIYVGGDAWESWGGSNRYVCIAMPCFFILFFQGVRAVGQRLRSHLAGRPGIGPAGVDRWLTRAAVALAAIALASFNAIYGPAALAEMALAKRPLYVEANELMTKRALVVDKITDPAARIAVVWDGAIVYFAQRPAISILGKNDRKIAREKMHRVGGAKALVAFYPGHLKWDYAYSIGTLKPDVVVQLWEEPETATPFLSRDYSQIRLSGFQMNVRKGSPHVRWDRVQSLSTE